jgi:hypothetical protein
MIERWRVVIAVLLGSALCACEWPQRNALRDTARAQTVLSACRDAMASLPPPGPPIDPAVYRLEPGDERYAELSSLLQSRTARFDGPREGSNPYVVDTRLAPEILQLQPLWVEVTPDTVHIGLCGAGLTCSVDAARPGLGREAFVGNVVGSEDCEALVSGLWYCHE